MNVELRCFRFLYSSLSSSKVSPKRIINSLERNHNYILVSVIISICVLLMYCSIFYATQQDEEFQYIAVFNQFYYSDSLTYIEIVSSIARNILMYVPENNEYKAEMILNIKFLKRDKIHLEKEWQHIDIVNNSEEAKRNVNLEFVDRLIIESGSYDIRLLMKDLHSDKQKQYQGNLKVRDFSDDSLQISDILISYDIHRDTSQSAFVKNGYMVTPYAEGLFGDKLPILFSYAEIYNLAAETSPAGKKLKLVYRVLNKDGEIVKTYRTKNINKVGNSVVDVHRITAVLLYSGNYIYEIEAEDMETGQKVSSQKNFFVYRKGDFEKKEKDSKLAVVGSEDSTALDRYLNVIFKMPEVTLDQEFKYCDYIIDKKNKKLYPPLDLEGKRQYMFEFWKQIEKANPNYARDQYLARVQLANQQFKGNYQPGWNTERGRVFLVYGPPEYIERFPSSQTVNEYQVWHYYAIEGGIIFVFVDLHGYGKLRLVHSTARGEIYNPYWEEMK